MIAQINSESKLEVLKKKVVDYRRNGKLGCRIPETLWDAAVELTKDSSCNEVSKHLNLDLKGLKKRVGKITPHRGEQLLTAPGKPKFLELKMPIQQNERCVIEIDSPNGCKMHMQFSGENNGVLLDVVKTFIGREK